MKDGTMTRRTMLVSLAKMAASGAAAITLLPGAARADAGAAITVYKDPNCGCCTQWVTHLRAAGMTPTVHDRADVSGLKDSLGVPAALRACHTAVAGRYVIEGHVPAADIRALLARAPKGVVGIAVPDMPAGSPGMEMPGRRDRYDVIAFSADGRTSVFARH